jgi:uncharacterized protein (TIGR03083 family)
VTDPYDGDVGLHYRSSRERFVNLIGELTEQDFTVEVPTCPGWTVREVVAHVAGIPDDALHGRIQGPPDDAQTADQIARAAHLSVADLLQRWEEQSPDFQAVLTSVGRALAPAAIDVATHEQDVRGALHRPGSRYNPTIAWALPMMVHGVTSRVRNVGLPATRLVVEGDVLADGDPGGLTLNVTQFELFRAVLGRRSRAQVASYDWSGDPHAVLPVFFVFGPTAEDIVERV